MKRRDLLAALAAGLAWPALRLPRPSRAGRSPWTFRLDARARWTLTARDGRPVVDGAEVAAGIGGDDPVALGALERVRRFELTERSGAHAGWQIVGVAQGAEVAVQFLDGPPPAVAATIRGLADDRDLSEIRFFDTRTAEVAPLGGRPALWINGFLSTDPCRVVTLGPGTLATSHWGLAALPGSPHPAAFAFGADDAGEGRFDCEAGRIIAASVFRGRVVGAARAPASATLTIVPGTEALRAIGSLAAGSAGTRPDAPAGWCVCGAPGQSLTEEDVLASLEGAAAFRGTPLVVRIGDGYQRSAGDWEANERFPHGHRWLTDRIHAAGLRAGLWLAPLLVAERSGIPIAHPDWLLRGPDDDPLVVAEPADRGGRVFALDAAQVAVRDYLRDLARHTVNEWGYDDLTLDQLRLGDVAAAEPGGTGRAEAYRAALRALREGAGAAFVTGCRAPLQHAAGLVDAMRLGPDGGAGLQELAAAARSVALRAPYGATAWRTDPGALALGGQVTLEEARLWTTVVALAGGPAVAAEPPLLLPAERLELLKRAFPVLPLAEREYDVAPDGAAGERPSWILGRVADDWWMLAALNWSEEARRFAFPLAAPPHGVRGPLTAYDVWADRRLDDVDGQVALSVAPRSATVLSLRRRRRTPAVIGSTRHVLQGLDVRSERWDARRRTLAGTAVRLDDRPWAVTIALPPGFTPRGASSDPEAGAAVAVVGNGGRRAARLELAAPPGDAVSWEVAF